MGLFGKLKDAVGIGSMKAEIVLSAPGFHPGDTLGGNVVVSGAASDTKVSSVHFQLINVGMDVTTTEVITEDYYYGTQWESYDNKYKYKNVLYETYLAQQFVLAKGQQLELPLSIDIPHDAPPTDKYNRYVLRAHVDIPGQIDARASKPLHVMVGGEAPEMMEQPYHDEPAPGGDYPEPGERVLAYYEDGWYEATAGEFSAGSVHMSWDDGTDSWVSLDEVRPSEAAVPSPADLAVGMRVMARYEEGFYEATVGGVQGGNVGIQWDDGAQTWVTLNDIRLF